MTHPPQLLSKHDLALWLVNVLTNQKELGGSAVEGHLPDEFNFDEIDNSLNGFNIAGVCESEVRKIEFYPSWAGVFASLDELLSKPKNLANPPDVFTLRDSSYTHGASVHIPEQVANYLSACRLYQLMRSTADFFEDDQQRMVFLQRHDAKLSIHLKYEISQLQTLNGLEEFSGTFVNSEHHKDQKRTIIRSSLIDLFKGKPSIDFGDFLQEFEDFMERVRSAYAMYVAEFSFEKIKAEVEKDNLDSTVRLQKAITDIQNQLLALPVAVLLAGGQMSVEISLTIKNSIVWLGSIIFVVITMVLIANQKYTIRAISQEINLRQSKLDILPVELKSRFKEAFKGLKKHVDRQRLILNWLLGLVVCAGLLSTGLLGWYSMECIRLRFSS